MHGPLTNFIVAIIAMFGKQSELMQTIIYANTVIGIFNLLPIYPMDGGRILNEILHITVGLNKAYTYAHNITKVTIVLLTVVASIAILYLQNIAIIFILGYLWSLVLKENIRYKYNFMKSLDKNEKNDILLEEKTKEME